MSKYKPPHRALCPNKAGNNKPDYNFVFSDKISDWMPRERVLSETFKDRIAEDSKWRNTSGFSRANNGMACSERRIIK